MHTCDVHTWNVGNTQVNTNQHHSHLCIHTYKHTYMHIPMSKFKLASNLIQVAMLCYLLLHAVVQYKSRA